MFKSIIFRKPKPNTIATHFIEKVKLGKINQVRNILNSGFDPDTKFYASKTTALHIAAGKPPLDNGVGNPKMVELLLEYHADPTHLDHSGKSALDYAISLGDNPFFLEKMTANHQTRTPQQIQDDFYNVTEILLSTGVQPHQGFNALIKFAEQFHNGPTLELLKLHQQQTKNQYPRVKSKL